VWEIFWRQLRCVEARGRASGDRISGFWSWEFVEHVFGFGFIRRSLDLHRSDKLSHGLLGLLDFDTAQSHHGCEMSWSLDPADKHVWLQMVGCTWESSLLCRDVYLMPRMKFGFETMLNIIWLLWYQSHSSNFLVLVDIFGVLPLPLLSSSSHCQKRVIAVTPTVPATLEYHRFAHLTTKAKA